MTLSLKLLGAPSLVGPDGPIGGAAVQRHRLALLALLAGSRRHSLGREKLLAWLWPERDAEHARRLLNQSVHVLRRALGGEAIRSVGEELVLDPEVVECDTILFEEAVAGGELEQAVTHYTGPFLDGFFLSEAPEFEQWVDRERARLAALLAETLERLADAAEASGDWRGAIKWWQARADHDPLDSRVASRLMRAYFAAGNRAAALQHVAAHQRLLQEELGLDPPADLLQLAEQIRSAPPAPGSGATLDMPAVPPDSPIASPPGRPRPIPEADVPHRRRGAILAIAALVVAGVWLGVGRPGWPVGESAVPASSVDAIARAVARELGRRERGDTGGRQAAERTRSIPAYELYLRGSDPVLLRSDSAARLAREYLERAVELDSNYAAAWAGLARLILRTRLGSPAGTPNEDLATAEAAARRALVLDDSLAEAHAAVALIRLQAFDLSEAEGHLRRAVALAPDVALFREHLNKLYLWMGRGTEALAEARQAFDAAPVSPTASAELARALMATGDCASALSRLGTLEGLQPPLARVAGIAAQCHARARAWPEAIAAMRPQAAGGDPLSLGELGYFLAAAGQQEEAAAIAARLEQRFRTGTSPGWPVALVYLGLADREQALTWLHRAVADHSLMPFSEPSPLTGSLLDGYRSDSVIARIRGGITPQKR